MRVLYWSIAILLLLIIGFSITTAIYVDKYLEEYVGKRLREESVHIRGNRYQVNASSIETDILSGNIRLKDMTISPSPLIEDTLKERAIGYLQASAFHVEGFDLLSYYTEGIIRIEKVLVFDPQLKGYFRKSEENNEMVESLVEKLEIHAPEVFIDSIRIRNGKASIFRIENRDTTSLFFIEKYHSRYGYFHLDSFIPGSEFPFSYQFASIHGVGLKTQLSYYQNLSVDSFGWNSLDSIFHLRQFQVQPTLTPEVYTAGLSFQNDWFAADIDKIDIVPFDPKHFLDNQYFDLRTIDITHLKAIFYRDITLPREDLEKMLPVSAISRIPWETKVRKLRTKKAYITYREKYDAEKEPFVFSLDEMEFITGPLSTREQPGFSWDVNAKILGEIPFSAHVDFKIEEGIEKFSASGGTQEVNFNQLNPLVEALAPVQFSAGKINSLSFELKADEDTSSGFLDLEYENLKLEMTKVKEGEVRSQKFMSFAANTVKKTHNKKGRSNYKTGKIFAQRDKRKSFFNFFWRSIESGLLSSINAGNYDKKHRKKQLDP